MTAGTPATAVSEARIRVNYSETDQMGVVYHARYLVWLDIARTEHLRRTGLSYLELEALGFRLVLADLGVRYRHAARYDDLVRIRCWVRELASRRVTFGYVVEHEETGRLLATAWTALVSLDTSMTPVRLPAIVASALHPIADPVRI